MFRPRFRMLRTSLVVCMILGFPVATLARGPHHRGPRVHHHHHHHRGGPSWGAFLFGAVTGAVVHELLSPPRDAVVVEVRGTRYYRAGGYYYSPRWRGDHWVYVPVDPPPAVIIAEPAPAPPPIIVQGQTYYRSPTTPYQSNATTPNPPATVQAPKASETIPTPAAARPLNTGSSGPAVGSVVRQLPSGAIAVRIGTTDYYAADGVYYLPVRVEGETRYVAVDDPTRTQR